MYNDVGNMLEKVTTRMAIDLFNSESEGIVLAMNNANVEGISTEAIPQTHQDSSHGPSKGGNFAQKSVAALMGLGQFGISRIIFRDELNDGRVERFSGPIRSIIIFDTEEPVKDGRSGIIYPSQAWRDFLMSLFDFTNVDPEINKYRFCSYIPQNDKGCGKCINCCPSGAQPSSTPEPTGNYSETISRQAHRFWENKLQFDFGKCCDERGQMAGLLPEWSCARCLTICINQGNRRKQAAETFYKKIEELTRERELTGVSA